LGAKNITSEKMDTSGFSSGGVSEGGARHTPKNTLTKTARPLTSASRGKGPFGGKESKATAGVPAPGRYKG
jgi:hypothetical protein